MTCIDMTNEQKYQAIVEANPEVLRLVEDLDLVNPETGLPFGVQAVSQEKLTKLSSIAQRVLNRGRIYTCEQVVSRMEETLRISRDRAVRGFEMMMSTGVLTSSTGSGFRLAI